MRTQIAMYGCHSGPPPFTIKEVVEFGPLPAGLYTYEVYTTYESEAPILEARMPLAIAAVPVPALDAVARLVLALAIGGAGAALLRRY